MKIFITGTFRSGTTLLSHIIKVNPDISMTYDSVHFMRFGYKRYGINKINFEDALRLGKDFYKRLKSRFNKAFDLELYKEKMSKCKFITYSYIYDTIMKLHLGNNNWGEKTVLEWRSSVDLFDMFNDIFVIHTIRDPRDVLSSWKYTTKAPGKDYLDAIGNCYDSMKYALKNSRNFPKRYYVLRFEDLVDNPKKEIKKLCNFTGLDFNEEMINSQNFMSKIGGNKKWKPDTPFKDKIKGISQKPVGRWKNKLDREDLFLCEMSIDDNMMNKFKYKKSNNIWNIRDVFNSFKYLYQSPLAYSGIMNIIHYKEGVERNPLDHFDSSTWDMDPDSY